jgi:hypothetical protein
MKEELWDAPHSTYGTPESIAARYLGALRGIRRWHGFEVWAGGEERGVIFMPDQDLAKITVTAITG